MINKFQKMGVINVTPNSFSDGQKFNSFSTFSKQFKSLTAWADIIDVGAESTAPFNVPITEKEEIKRLSETLLAYVEQNEEPAAIAISIDTYRPSTFYKIATELKKYWGKVKIIFNDVSGIVDSELEELLDSSLDFTYVFSHNLAPKRELTSNHMDYVKTYAKEEDFTKDIHLFFLDGLQKIAKRKEVFLDPCFGFSKTREQNHILLRECANLMSQLEQSFVYGISRKSFLRFPKDLDAKNVDNQKRLDHLQSYFLLKEMQKAKHSIFFRIHEQRSFESALETYNILHT